MHTKKLLAGFVLGLGLTLALLWSMEATLAVAAPAAELTVTKFTDSADGACDSDCSLREAIIAANDNYQDNTIVLGTGTYVLSLVAGATDPVTGDLDITSNYALTITGNGPQNTFIDANGIDRVIHISYGPPTLVISGVTIMGGATTDKGGGIYSRGDQDLILINTAVISNSATRGGGLQVENGSRAVLAGVQFGSNSATYGGGVHLGYSTVVF